jgi:hypothetical protein
LPALVGPTSGALLRKEKDGISPPNLFLAARRISSIPRLRSLEVFYFQKPSDLALVSQPKPFRVKIYFRGAKNERSVV